MTDKQLDELSQALNSQHIEDEKAEDTPAYKIEFSDTEAWKKHLKEEGYVVVTKVVGEEEVNKARSLVWDWFEGLASGIDRGDPKTWQNANWPGVTNLGFLSSHGGGQSEAAWYLRGQPNVTSVFSSIWGTEELLTSMDTFICWRPWHLSQELVGEDWDPKVERLHCDQSPVRRPGFHCVQGMVPLLPVSSTTGGLQVVPKTNTDETQEYLRSNYGRSGDWCELRPNDKYIGTGQLLSANPGDMILWDSRTIHGGHVPEKPCVPEPGTEALPGLMRLSLTVCMLPKEGVSTTVLQSRANAVKRGITCTHWPNQFVPHSFGDSDGRNIEKGKYVPPKLTREQARLVC